MAGQAPTVDGKKIWGGGTSPYNVSYGKMMMWFFLISDALTFSAFLVSYGFFRHTYENLWGDAESVFTHFPFMHGDNPLLYVAFMTFVLIMSSVTMVLAVHAGHNMDKKGVVRNMILTIIGGIAFLSCQAWEWNHLFHEGASITHNPFPPGNSAFTSLFFTITGFHGFHVFSGVIINIIIYFMTVRGVFEKRGHYEMIEKVGLYWHFVDLVWVFVFTLFYLL